MTLWPPDRWTLECCTRAIKKGGQAALSFIYVAEMSDRGGAGAPCAAGLLLVLAPAGLALRCAGFGRRGALFPPRRAAGIARPRRRCIRPGGDHNLATRRALCWPCCLLRPVIATC